MREKRALVHARFINHVLTVLISFRSDSERIIPIAFFEMVSRFYRHKICSERSTQFSPRFQSIKTPSENWKSGGKWDDDVDDDLRALLSGQKLSFS